ncbi:MAG: YIP1 family protein [Candidatus Melainabacteria bacterium]|nr:YIP1 family protein [Candidatus Melainabacteria bacterium]
MNSETSNPEQTALSTETILDEGPNVGFLETFYGVLFNPRKTFEKLYSEDSFTVVIYGILAVFLSNIGKLEPGHVNFINILGVEFIGFLSWFFVGLFIIFFSTVFKTPNNNLARLLGFTGLASIPFLLMTPANLLGHFVPFVYAVCMTVISIWAFILFWISLAKSFQLEAWRVLLMAIIPFLLGIFLFTFLIANIFGMLFTGAAVH